MSKSLVGGILLMLLSSGAFAQSSAPTCEDLVWSAQVLAANPDVGKSCQGVFQRGDTLYAKVQLEVARARGNRVTFKLLHTDGTKGESRSVAVPNSWRANIDGESLRARELQAGQVLNVYLPEDRFALLLHDEESDGEFPDEEELITIEEATVVTMPATASARYDLAAAGLLFLALGAAMSWRRLGVRVHTRG